MRPVRALAVMIACMVATGCTAIEPLEARTAHAVQLAAAVGFVEGRGHTQSFDFATFAAAGVVQKTDLVIYIEGDGLAFLAPDIVSDDPTPLEPVGLELALAAPADVNSNVVYLARPCQFTGMLGMCRKDYWTGQRFAPELISATDDVVSQLKERYGARHLTLVGYSGGAALAALVAERRDDVARLVSVAGNLSTRRWTEMQGLSPLRGSLDPYDQRARLVGISQWHFVGRSDSVVPASLTEQFVAGMANARVVAIDGFDHVCCWVKRWPALWQDIAQPP